ncbi:response regulator [Singulisphaera rosea]
MNTPDPGESLTANRPRILLVEDNDAASKGLSRILAVMGYDVTVVTDGTSALESLRSAPPPDFLLTDLRLPDLDGREVARFASQLVPRPRVALITGWDMDTTVQDRKSWGINWVLLKPLDISELMAKLRNPDGDEPETPGPTNSN